MRISKSDGYHTSWQCHILGEDCVRLYCKDHRLLYCSCETVIPGTEGDRDVIGGTRMIFNVSNECPECDKEWKRKKYGRFLKESI